MIAIVTTALAIRVTADDPAPTPGMLIYSGILRSVDLKARTIAVDGSAIPQRFVVPTDAEIIVKDKPKGALDDLMIGDGIMKSGLSNCSRSRSISAAEIAPAPIISSRVWEMEARVKSAPLVPPSNMNTRPSAEISARL